MRHLHTAELRDSWTTWLSVSLTFIAVNAMIATTALFDAADAHAVATGAFKPEPYGGNGFIITMNYTLSGLIGLLVIGTVTGLVITSRRGSIARLGLAGASPLEIIGTLMTQLAVVSLACALVGDVVAALLVQPALDKQTATQDMPHIAAVVAVGPVLLANLGCVLVAMVGGLRAAVGATRISPVEALRESQSGPAGRKKMVGRIIWAAILTLIIAGTFVGVAKIPANEDPQGTISAIAQAAMTTIPLGAMLLSTLAPFTMGAITRIWTRIIPSPTGTWHLARNTVLGKMDRLVRTVVPIMVTLAILFGMFAVGTMYGASVDAAAGEHVELTGTDIWALVLAIGAPLLIAVAGALSAILMMAHQREAELALDGVLGVTPAQRIMIPLLEAVIVTVTAALNALVIVGLMSGVLYIGLRQILPGFQIVLPWGTFFGLTGLVFVAIAICTVVPTLRSLRTPEPRVIARYVAA